MAKAEYKTVIKDGFSEVVEKKSRFLGEAVHAETLADAEAYIAAVKKRHYDARHHCFAFVVGVPGTPGEITRSSDDGEPSGTAGKPMLEVLTGRQLHKTLLVVTRYFGGTLLGTDGLHRAYAAAAKEAAEAAEIAEVKLGMRLMVTCSYTLLGKLQYLFAGEGIETIESTYADDVKLTVLVPLQDLARVRKLITEAADGKAALAELGEMPYQKPCNF